MFAALTGDFSPLSTDMSGGQARLAPPALVVAAAIGLGSIDMPIPEVAAWEWVNWRFPKAVKAGDTIYARWTLTQKRPPVHGATTAIAVWRVDVHTADGAVCAEGEVGASIARHAGAHADHGAEAQAAGQRRRRRRRSSGTAEAGAAPAPPPASTAAASAAATPASAAERAGGARRRRRRRPSGSGAAASNGEPAAASRQTEPAPAPAADTVAAPAPSARDRSRSASANPISRAIRRLRRS